MEKDLKDISYSRLPLPSVSEAPLEATPYTPASFSNYEKEKGTPYIAEKLGVIDKFRLDPKFSLKVRAIESYIKEEMTKENLQDSLISVNTILSRILPDYGNSLEFRVGNRKGDEVIENLFTDIALRNSQSTESFIKTFQEKFKKQRIQIALSMLRETLV